MCTLGGYSVRWQINYPQKGHLSTSLYLWQGEHSVCVCAFVCVCFDKWVCEHVLLMQQLTCFHELLPSSSSFFLFRTSVIGQTQPSCDHICPQLWHRSLILLNLHLFDLCPVIWFYLSSTTWSHDKMMYGEAVRRKSDIILRQMPVSSSGLTERDVIHSFSHYWD